MGNLFQTIVIWSTDVNALEINWFVAVNYSRLWWRHNQHLKMLEVELH